MLCSASLLLFSKDRFRSMGCCRKPVLLVTPKLKAATAAPAFSFRLLPVLALGLFPVEKLAPDRNNIRSICKLPGSGEGGNAEPKLLPTPHYNNSIAQVRMNLNNVQLEDLFGHDLIPS